MITQAVISDSVMAGCFKQYAEVVGDHDDPREAPHLHYSVLTIEDGVVTHVDWGYHPEDVSVWTERCTFTKDGMKREWEFRMTVKLNLPTPAPILSAADMAWWS